MFIDCSHTSVTSPWTSGWHDMWTNIVMSEGVGRGASTNESFTSLSNCGRYHANDWSALLYAGAPKWLLMKGVRLPSSLSLSLINSILLNLLCAGSREKIDKNFIFANSRYISWFIHHHNRNHTRTTQLCCEVTIQKKRVMVPSTSPLLHSLWS